MPKKIHYLVCKTPSGSYLTPRMGSYVCKNLLHALIGRFEFYDSNFDEMKKVLGRICRDAAVRVQPGSVIRESSFELAGSKLTHVIITASLLDEEPKLGYFMPLAGHTEAEMLHEKLGLPKPLKQVA